LEQLTNLKKLSLAHTKLKDCDLSTLTHLEALNLEYKNLENGLSLSHLKKLKRMYLSGPYNSRLTLVEEHVSYFVHLTCLHTLSFSYCVLPNQFGRNLKQLKALKHLVLWNCSNIASQLMILDGMLLKTFSLTFARLGELFSEFPSFPELFQLYLGVSLINDQWIENLPIFPKVQILGITYSQITNESLNFLSNLFPSLTELNVEGCTKITEFKDHLFLNLMYLRQNTKIKTAFIHPTAWID